jgi:predicted phage terminase large subunit-like protein
MNCVNAASNDDYLAELFYERKLRNARTNLLDFTRFTMPDFRESWHHRLVASKLDQFVRGEIENLAITMPPRHTKSEFVSRRLPAFIFGVNPNAKIISCSYGADLASMMNRDVQRILESPEYREVFPNTRLNESNVRTDSHGSYLRNSEIFEIVGYKGIYKCAGVGGSITGFGFDYGIIDDPIRNRADAESPTYRKNLKDWYTSVFRTRKQKGAGILITLTRWQEDDLLGWILDLAEKNPNTDQFELISLPALSEEPLAPYDQRTEPNKALWEDEFTTEDMLRTKETLTVYEWLSLYQQRPSAAAGNLVKKEQFKYCELAGDVLIIKIDANNEKRYILQQCKLFQTCDPAASTKTSADFFTLGTWAQTPDNNLCLIDLIHTRLETPDQVPLFWQAYIKWKSYTTNFKQWVATRGLGIGLFQTLKKEGLPVDEIQEDTDKVSRFIPAATRIATGTVFILDTLPGLHDVEAELLGFPNAAHDDLVDMCSLAVDVMLNEKILTKFDISSMFPSKKSTFLTKIR